jgi:hypothetical protein
MAVADATATVAMNKISSEWLEIPAGTGVRLRSHNHCHREKMTIAADMGATRRNAHPASRYRPVRVSPRPGMTIPAMATEAGERSERGSCEYGTGYSRPAAATARAHTTPVRKASDGAINNHQINPKEEISTHESNLEWSIKIVILVNTVANPRDDQIMLERPFSHRERVTGPAR